MPKQKYYYAVVDKQDGLLTHSKFPIMANRKYAKDIAKDFGGYRAVKILITDLEKLILSSKPL